MEEKDGAAVGIGEARHHQLPIALQRDARSTILMTIPIRQHLAARAEVCIQRPIGIVAGHREFGTGCLAVALAHDDDLPIWLHCDRGSAVARVRHLARRAESRIEISRRSERLDDRRKKELEKKNAFHSQERVSRIDARGG